MSLHPDAEGNFSPVPLYARFSRRLRGIFIDWALTLAVIMASLLMAASVRSDSLSRSLGVVVVVLLLLYEPVLVSRFGGTLGHTFSNLRVVDDRSGGNVSFLKAIARAVIKGLLGWYSFLVIAATRRNQALHDVLTRSTVQIRTLRRRLHLTTSRSGRFSTQPSCRQGCADCSSSLRTAC